MLLGGVLSLCNIYSGLKIGWNFNVAITACLLAAAFWRVTRSLFGTPPFGLLECTISATAASAAASVASAGLVSGIPALTMLTGYAWRYEVLAAWVLIVCMEGVVVAIGMRRQFIVVAKLRFP